MDAPVNWLADQGGAFDAARFMDVAERFGHGALLGIRYAGEGPGWAELAMDAAAAPAAGTDDALAFGPLATLLDMACGLSIWMLSRVFRMHATLDLRIDRLREPRAGSTLIARGECLRLEGEVAFVRALAHDGDPTDPVALAAGTFMLTDPAR